MTKARRTGTNHSDLAALIVSKAEDEVPWSPGP